MLANRRNARRSTGPRTADGKRRSSQNAVSHGVYCRDLVLPGESKVIFNALRDSYLQRLNPKDAIELFIVDRIVAAAWKLQRLQTAELFVHTAEATAMKNVEDERGLHERDEPPPSADRSADRSGERSAERSAKRSAERSAGACGADAAAETERFAAPLTLAMNMMRGELTFDRLTQIEQRLERSVHRNLEALRRLRKADDELSLAGLQKALRPCPFVSNEPQESVVEPLAAKEVRDGASPTEPVAKNEPIERGQPQAWDGSPGHDASGNRPCPSRTPHGRPPHRRPPLSRRCGQAGGSLRHTGVGEAADRPRGGGGAGVEAAAGGLSENG